MTENKRFLIGDAGELIDLNNHKFIDYGDECCKILNELNDENEQLKKENYELHKRLGDFEPYEEHIKEITSKTSVNDIIGLVKTDEPTDIVELKRSYQND